MITFEELQNKKLTELMELMENYPYSSIFPVMAAKRAYHESSVHYDELVAKAALRVPSRKSLKKYITEAPPTKGSLQSILSAPFGKKSTSSTSNLVSPLVKATEEDEGEIVLENLETLRPVEADELPVNEVVVDGQRDRITIDEEGIVQDDEVVEIQGMIEVDELLSADQYPISAEGYVLDNPTTSYPQNIEVDEHQEVVVPTPKKIDVHQLADQSTQQSAKEEPFTDTKLKKENTSKQSLPIENDHVDEISDSLILDETNHDHIAVSRVPNEHDLEKTPLPIEDDSVDEIGDHFISEQAEQVTAFEAGMDNGRSKNEIDETQPVSSLGDDETTSMYQKIVNLLKEDNPQANYNTSPISKVVESDDRASNFSDEESKDDQNSELTVASQTIVFDEYDHELEQLYAKAAYEAQIDQEAEQSSLQVDSNLNIEASKEPDEEQGSVNKPAFDMEPINDENHTFSEWLGQLSSMGSSFYQEQQHKKVGKNQPPVDHTTDSTKKENTSEESGNILQPTDEEVEDERPTFSTKEVQKMAKKSLVPNTGYYTETLAYVYEMQEKWDKALEVYEYLSLKNPEKSRYFASQIKLLKEKLK